MVFFSIIVPIHDVAAYLPDCLSSILEQSFADFEVIGVDDSSRDSSGSILDGYATADPRVHPIHLADQVGPGLARNAALDVAVGDYVLFLDGDDTFAPNSLSEIAKGLTLADLPDVMVFNYSRTWPDGTTSLPPDGAVFAELGRTTFTPRSKPAILGPPGFSCTKACKREFLEATDLRFGPGIYEDISWSYLVLLNARTVIARDWVVVLYRQRPAGSILNTTSAAHFDVFDQYDLVFRFLDQEDVSAAVRTRIYETMINHFVAIWQHPGRLVKSDRRPFLTRASQLAVKYQPVKAAGVPRNVPTSLRSALLRKRHFATFRSYSWLDQKRHSRN